MPGLDDVAVGLSGRRRRRCHGARFCGAPPGLVLRASRRPRWWVARCLRRRARRPLRACPRGGNGGAGGRAGRGARPGRRYRGDGCVPRHHPHPGARSGAGGAAGPRQRLTRPVRPAIPVYRDLERHLMSSHREAPEISKDPVADSTDLYAFVSPDKPGTVTLIANYVPLEGPAGGPNFYEFGDDVLYEIHIDTDGHGEADITYQFRFHTQLPNPDTFLYNTGPITSLTSPAWNRRQIYSVTRVDGRGQHTLGAGPDLPAVQHRPAVHAGLRGGAGRACGARALRRQPGVRRPARRRLLRRPRLDLRPARPAAVPEPAGLRQGPGTQAAPGSTRPSSSTCTRSPCRCRSRG